MTNREFSAGRVDRRTFLRAGARAAGTVGVMAAFGELFTRSAQGLSVQSPAHLGYGPPSPVHDETTGLPLLKLPRGFRYSSFGWRNDLMSNGALTPSGHDGMGVVSVVGGDTVILVRNHEISNSGNPFGTNLYDTRGRGGTTTLSFSLQHERWLGSFPSLGGTSRNCAGGPTPWGSWLTCEEVNVGAVFGFNESHGWIFEVPALQPAHARPLKEMGRFSHEAVAVDPLTGFVYETEDDRYTSALYRFRPLAPLQLYGLEQGGLLEALKVVGVTNADLQQAPMGATFPVEWVPVPDPLAPPQSGVGPFGSFDGQTTSASGPFLQAHRNGAARFRRLEGCWAADGLIYFVDTEGGRPASDTGDPEGSIWSYDPLSQTLRVVFESPAESVLDNPDNLCVSPRGGILLCEDGDRDALRLHGLTPGGLLFPFAENNVVLNGEVNGFVGDFRDREWCGATFDPTGTWLFVNIQTPGITFAITGPWSRGPL